MSHHEFSPCSWGSSMLKPTERPPAFLAAAVGGLHHPGTAAGDDREPGLGERAAGSSRALVGGRALEDARRPEDRDRRAVDLLDGLEPGEELGRDQRDVAGERLLACPQNAAIELRDPSPS